MGYAAFFEEGTGYREAGQCLHEVSDTRLLVPYGLLAGYVGGKQLRGTTPHGRRQAPVQLVSVWAT